MTANARKKGARKRTDARDGAREVRRVSPARSAAFEVLRRVEEEGAFASVVLAHAGDGLRVEDRALCYELTLGVLRWQLWLDCVIGHYAGRDTATIDAPVRRALRLGLYQLRFLSRVPQSAAVNESVNLAHATGQRASVGFVNAVLRRATREPEFDPATLARDELERISIATSHPAWLVARWAAEFGASEAELIARANNRTPPVAFRVNTLRADERELIAKLCETGVEVTASKIAEGAWRVAAGTGGEALRALASGGVVYTQDEASQLAGRAVGACAGERVLDVCAAPGSKATQIAVLTNDRALVVACDVYEHRLRTIVESARRQGIENILTVALDAEESPLPFVDGSFDRVLVDAPCTGTGTLRHNPEIRWRITPSDVVELAARQRRILANAARAVRTGGRLIYLTCSFEREENESVVESFLAAHAEFRQARADAPTELLTPTGAARTFPHRDDADGFFVAVLERA
jgi:16S rRNA (cytosine967-C5)-methyltransferase